MFQLVHLIFRGCGGQACTEIFYIGTRSEAFDDIAGETSAISDESAAPATPDGDVAATSDSGASATPDIDESSGTSPGEHSFLLTKLEA